MSRLRTVVGGALVVAVAFVAFRLATYKQPLRDEVARLRAAGFATTVEEWHGPPPPAWENGAPEFLAALAWLDAQSDGTPRWDVGPFDHEKAEPWTASMTESEWATLRQRLDAAAPCFDRIAAALEAPRFVFAPVLDASRVDTSPDVPRRQFAARLLDGRAASATTPEQRRAALRCLARLATRPEKDNLISVLVGASLWTKACGRARDAVATGSLSATDARQAFEPWPRTRWIDRIPGIARGELAQMPDVLDAALDGRWPGPPLANNDFGSRLKVLARRAIGRGGGTVSLAGILKFERWWETLTPEDAASGLRWWAGVAQCPSGTHAEIRAWAERTLPRTDAAQNPLTYTLTTLVRRLTLADARTALARGALAARERFDATGAWPASLGDLADAFPGGVPLDPVTGAAFTYEVGDATVRIASGATRTDDETDPDQSAESWLRAEVLLWEFPR